MATVVWTLKTVSLLVGFSKKVTHSNKEHKQEWSSVNTLAGDRTPFAGKQYLEVHGFKFIPQGILHQKV